MRKAVQTFIEEVEWPPLSSTNEWVGKKCIKIKHPILWKLNKRISLVTNLVTDIHGSTTQMQVTNYGLGGLCQAHMDATGMSEQDEKLLRARKPHIFIHGDVIATFMAWLGLVHLKTFFSAIKRVFFSNQIHIIFSRGPEIH